MTTIKYGVDEELEEQANELIRRSLEGVTSHEAKSDILTPAKAAVRRQRTVQVTGRKQRRGRADPHQDTSNSELLGQPDRHMRLGMFRRVVNLARPDLNSRDGIAPVHRSKGVVGWDAGLTPTPVYMTITREAWLRGDDYDAQVRRNRVRG
jgi:hypothetical protein